LQLLLEHMVLSHQGKKEFASPVEPMTPEALVLHFIDDLDSKLNQLRAARDSAVLTNGISFSKGFGRYVYTPAISENGLDNGQAVYTDPAPHAEESTEDLRDLELQPPLFQGS